MKYLRRYLSLLFALVMSLSLFSVTAHADEVDSSGVRMNSVLWGEGDISATIQTNINNGASGTATGSKVGNYSGKTLKWFVRSIFVNIDESPLFLEGKNYTFQADNLYFLIEHKGITDSSISPANANIAIENAYLSYMDGTSENIRTKLTYEYNARLGTYTLKCSFTPKKDVRTLTVTLKIPEYTLSHQTEVVSLLVGTTNEYPYTLNVEVQSEEAGLLSGIIGKLTEVWDAITNGFKNVVNSITELPQKIWCFIEDGLKNLFVPSEESMTAYKDKWDSLLADRFGAIYEVGAIIHDVLAAIQSADQTNTIDVPLVSINLPGGSTFSFGGWNVKIVPDGFEFLVNAVKLIIGIIATVAFANGMRNKYDEIMGVEK